MACNSWAAEAARPNDGVQLDREETPCSATHSIYGAKAVPEEVVLGLLGRVDTGGTEGSPNRPTIAAGWSATRGPTSPRSKELKFQLLASNELKFLAWKSFVAAAGPGAYHAADICKTTEHAADDCLTKRY